MISKNSLRQLEFDKLLKLISGFANSGATETAVAELSPFCEIHAIRERQSLISDILRLYSNGESLSLRSFPDLRPFFAMLRPEGSVLEGFELAGFTPFLSVLEEIYDQLCDRQDAPSLAKFSQKLGKFSDLRKILTVSIDSEGNILDTASATLSELRSRIRKIEARIRKKLEEMTRSEAVSIFLQDDFVTTRSGRWVIPVRMDSKGQVAGVVHDVSKSGETAFIEPVAIISLSNELENLNAEQKAEEIRILRNISSRIRERLEDIEASFYELVYLDALNCVSRFAIQLDMSIPEINTQKVISLNEARHPILSVSFSRHGGDRRVTPLNVRLGGDSTVMVITGANAGGKTITIKTIGLLTLMALSGMPIPADSSSSIPLINDLLIDIGDEQSIENDLSTFSAHISNISIILEKANEETLVLIDELGTGTEPLEGAAIACAVLNELREKKSLVFATTHLSDIKGYVHRTSGMINASMEFDSKTLTPLYRLRVGEPGQSHAIEIAGRYGLPARIIESARRLLGRANVEFENLIRDLSEKRDYFEETNKEIERLRQELEERKNLLDQLEASTKRERESILARAYAEAAELLTSTKRELNSLLEEAKKADRKKIRETLKVIDGKQADMLRRAEELAPTKKSFKSIEDVCIGETVYIRSIDASAEVVSIDKRNGRIRVRRGSVEVEVPFSAVTRGEKAPEIVGSRIEGKTMNRDIDFENIVDSLNIIGLRVDDALAQMEPFLNHAALSGIKQVSIIHGVGTGVLRRAVRESLTGHPLVESFASEDPDRGGAGVTKVILK